MIGGPHNAASLCNAVRCTEQCVDWIVECIRYLRAHGLSSIAPTADAEAAWTEHVQQAADATLLGSMTDSWFFGANTPSKPRAVTIYAGGARDYRERCDDVAARGYAGFELG